MATVAWSNTLLTGGGGAALPVVLNGSLTATTNTYTFPAGSNVWLEVVKTGANPCTVTVTTPGTVRGVGIADPTYNVPATTGNVKIGPFPPDLFADSSGLVNVVFSEVTGLSAGPFQLP